MNYIKIFYKQEQINKLFKKSFLLDWDNSFLIWIQVDSDVDEAVVL